MSFKYLFLGLLLFPIEIFAQSLKGTVCDNNKIGIAYVSIYIKELTLGTLTNEEGKFDVPLPMGKYTVIFYHMSYESVTKIIEIPSNILEIDLKTKRYELPAVIVGSKQEDPAYAIIRKAISTAPYYNKQLLSFKAEVYTKGSASIDKISSVVKFSTKKDLKRLGVKEGEKYIQENVSLIDYSKNKYHQKVLSQINTFPAELDLRMGMNSYNIYNPNTDFGFISPISQEAFTYYKYQLEGFVQEGNLIINRIKVIPRKKNDMTVSGYIYIADNYWFVRRFEFEAKNLGIHFNIKQEYGELSESIWMPINYSLFADINVIGNKAKVNYFNSVKYLYFEINPTKQGLVKFDKQKKFIARTKKEDQILKQIEKLSEKEKLTNKDAYRIAQLMQKKEKEEQKIIFDSVGQSKSLEIKFDYKFEKDSLANNKDSTYWAQMRPIPLDLDEIIQYKKRDSLILEYTNDTVKRKKNRTIPGSLLFGKRYYIADSSLVIRHEGLLSTQFFYNVVDGYIYDQNINIRKKFKDTTFINFDLNGSYAFARKELMFKSIFDYQYLPEKQAGFKILFGHYSMDFNETGINRFDNTIWTLFTRQNYFRFYQNSYLNLSHSIEPINGLMTLIGLSYVNRTRLENHGDFSFFYTKSRDFEFNNSINSVDSIFFTDNIAGIIDLQISYTPEMYYYKWDRKKRNFKSKYPTFKLIWRKGIPNIFSSVSNFDQIELRISQSIESGFMKKFGYQFTLGYFPNNRRMHFSDFKHFAIKPYYFSFATYENSFALIPMYSLSEMKRYVNMNIFYECPFFLLKHLPILNNTLITESLQLNYINTSLIKNYYELSYGLKNIFGLGELGVIGGFKGVTYKNIGLRVAFNLSIK